MANGRFVSRSIAHDLPLNDLSMEAHLLYLHAIPHLDRDGCITAEPNALWAMVCPLLDVRKRMPQLVQELCRSGLAQLTDDGGLWFKGFAKNQVLPPTKYDREAPSKYTIPAIDNATPAHVQHNGSTTPPISLREDQDQEEEEVQEEEKDKEQQPSLSSSAEFSAVVKAYEKEIGTLTGMIRDELIVASEEYPSEWIIDAIHEAVVNNKRKWKYVMGILRNWKTEGRNASFARNGNGTGTKVGRSMAAIDEVWAMMQTQESEAWITPA